MSYKRRSWFTSAKPHSLPLRSPISNILYVLFCYCVLFFLETRFGIWALNLNLGGVEVEAEVQLAAVGSWLLARLLLVAPGSGFMSAAAPPPPASPPRAASDGQWPDIGRWKSKLEPANDPVSCKDRRAEIANE
jgi:hypothetical protein